MTWKTLGKKKHYDEQLHFQHFWRSSVLSVRCCCLLYNSHGHNQRSRFHWKHYGDSCSVQNARSENKHNYYYVNMAVSDFFSCLITWPLYLTDEIVTSSGSLLQGSLATIGCKVGIYFKILSAIVSILSLVLISVDRFVAIVFPLKVRLISTKLRAALLFASWLISMGYCIPVFYYFRVEEVGHETFCRFSWNSYARMVYYITGLALFEVMPLIIIIILHSVSCAF